VRNPILTDGDLICNKIRHITDLRRRCVSHLHPRHGRYPVIEGWGVMAPRCIGLWRRGAKAVKDGTTS